MTLVRRLREQPNHSAPQRDTGTSAAGAMRQPMRRWSVVGVSRFVVTGNTLSGETARNFIDARVMSTPTTSAPVLQESAARADTNEATRRALTELRRLSGLTWDQLSQLFGVSRRSVHLWASGKPLSAHNEERLHELLALLKYCDRGSADENRKLLLTPLDHGENPLELVAAGKLEEVRNHLGPGIGARKLERTPLAAEAWEARLPPKPEDLVDARQDPIHRASVDVRGARSKRIDKGQE